MNCCGCFSKPSVKEDDKKAGARDSDEEFPDSAFVDAESNAESDFKSADAESLSAVSSVAYQQESLPSSSPFRGGLESAGFFGTPSKNGFRTGSGRKEFAAAKTEMDKQGTQGSVPISEWAATAATVAVGGGVGSDEEEDEFADVEGFEDAEEGSESPAAAPPTDVAVEAADVAETAVAGTSPKGAAAEVAGANIIATEGAVVTEDGVTAAQKDATAAALAEGAAAGAGIAGAAAVGVAAAAIVTEAGAGVGEAELPTGDLAVIGGTAGGAGAGSAAVGAAATAPGAKTGGPMALLSQAAKKIMHPLRGTDAQASHLACCTHPKSVSDDGNDEEGATEGILSKLPESARASMEGRREDEVAGVVAAEPGAGITEAFGAGAGSAAVGTKAGGEEAKTAEKQGEKQEEEGDEKMKEGDAKDKENDSTAPAGAAAAAAAAAGAGAASATVAAAGALESAPVDAAPAATETPVVGSESKLAEESQEETAKEGAAKVVATEAEAVAAAAAAAAAIVSAAAVDSKKASGTEGPPAAVTAVAAPASADAGMAEGNASLAAGVAGKTSKRARFMSLLSRRGGRKKEGGEVGVSMPTSPEKMAGGYRHPQSPLVLSSRPMSIADQSSAFAPNTPPATLGRAQSLTAAAMVSVPAPRHYAGSSVPCLTELTASNSKSSAVAASTDAAEAVITASTGDDFADATAEFSPDGASVAGGSDADSLSHYWAPLPSSDLMLRGEEYFRSGVKQPAYPSSPYIVKAVDMFQGPSRFVHITRLIQLPPLSDDLPSPASAAASLASGGATTAGIVTGTKKSALAMLALTDPTGAAVASDAEVADMRDNVAVSLPGGEGMKLTDSAVGGAEPTTIAEAGGVAEVATADAAVAEASVPGVPASEPSVSDAVAVEPAMKVDASTVASAETVTTAAAQGAAGEAGEEMAAGDAVVGAESTTREGMVEEVLEVHSADVAATESADAAVDSTADVDGFVPAGADVGVMGEQRLGAVPEEGAAAVEGRETVEEETKAVETSKKEDKERAVEEVHSTESSNAASGSTATSGAVATATAAPATDAAAADTTDSADAPAADAAAANPDAAAAANPDAAAADPASAPASAPAPVAASPLVMAPPPSDGAHMVRKTLHVDVRKGGASRRRDPVQAAVEAAGVSDVVDDVVSEFLSSDFLGGNDDKMDNDNDGGVSGDIIAESTEASISAPEDITSRRPGVISAQPDIAASDEVAPQVPVVGEAAIGSSSEARYQSASVSTGEVLTPQADVAASDEVAQPGSVIGEAEGERGDAHEVEGVNFLGKEATGGPEGGSGGAGDGDRDEIEESSEVKGVIDDFLAGMDETASESSKSGSIGKVVVGSNEEGEEGVKESEKSSRELVVIVDDSSSTGKEAGEESFKEVENEAAGRHDISPSTPDVTAALPTTARASDMEPLSALPAAGEHTGEEGTRENVTGFNAVAAGERKGGEGDDATESAATAEGEVQAVAIAAAEAEEHATESATVVAAQGGSASATLSTVDSGAPPPASDASASAAVPPSVSPASIAVDAPVIAAATDGSDAAAAAGDDVTAGETAAPGVSAPAAGAAATAAPSTVNLEHADVTSIPVEEGATPSVASSDAAATTAPIAAVAPVEAEGVSITPDATLAAAAVKGEPEAATAAQAQKPSTAKAVRFSGVDGSLPASSQAAAQPAFSTVGLPRWLVLNLQLPAPASLKSASAEVAKPSRQITTVSVVIYGQMSQLFWSIAPPQMADLLKGLKGTEGTREFGKRATASQALPFRERLKLVLRMGPTSRKGEKDEEKTEVKEGGDVRVADGGEGEKAVGNEEAKVREEAGVKEGSQEIVELILHPNQMLFRGVTFDGQSYLELDVDTARLSPLTRKQIEDRVPLLATSTIDVAIVCQANREEEAPEPVLMSARLSNLDLSKLDVL